MSFAGSICANAASTGRVPAVWGRRADVFDQPELFEVEHVLIRGSSAGPDGNFWPLRQLERLLGRAYILSRTPLRKRNRKTGVPKRKERP